MRGTLRFGPALTGALMLASTVASGPARAAEGMPQLDFANPLMLAQIVWLAIIFYALYLLLGRWALPQVAEVLAMRASTIREDLDVARAAKLRADAAVTELTAATREAHARAQAQVNEAVASARADQARQAASLGADLDRQLAEAEERITAARTAAMGALRQVAGEAAGVLVARLTGQTPEPHLVDAAVGHAMTQRG
jgi:F-type H+-transporting ATPase subunit b